MNNNNNSKTNSFKNNQSSLKKIGNTISNIKNNVSSGQSEAVIIFIIFFIMSAFAIYTLYNYYSSDFGINPSKTYYGIDLLNDVPIFTKSTNNITECIENCETDPICSGITYDNNNQLCVGIKNGKLRDDDSNFTSWIKTNKKFDEYLLKTLLVGNTSSEAIIRQVNVPSPSIVGEFTYTFWLNINSWYDNFKYWKHVWHRGDPIEKTMMYEQWDDIESDFPMQSPGIWLAPYTNNLRICFTVELNKIKRRKNRHPHSNVQICVDVNGIDVTQSKKEPEYCYTPGIKDFNSDNTIADPFQITNGICTDSIGNYTNYDEHNNIKLDECKLKCKNDEFCQGFSQHKNRPHCKVYGINKQKNGTNIKSIITGGNEGVYEGDKYSCYKKITYKDPLNDKDRILDYIDIPNIPVNKNTFIAVSFKRNMVEIYFNGELKTTKNLDGDISIPQGDLYIKNNKTYKGSIQNLSYTPVRTEYDTIKKYFSEKLEDKK